MADDAASTSPAPTNDFDLSRVHSAHILQGPNDVDTQAGATDKDTVQLVLSLPREEAERLADRLKNVDDQSAPSHVSAPSPQETVSAGRATRSKARASDHAAAPSASPTQDRPHRAQRSNGTAKEDAAPTPSAESSSASGPTSIEIQGFLDTERSYTNAFHKTLSLFVDDKTFSTPSLRAAVVGFLESSNATVLESLPQHNHVVPPHLRQEIENHVNLVKTVLQRGGVFAEDFLRARLKKLAAHIPRIEAAMSVTARGKNSAGGSTPTGKAPILHPRATDPYDSRDLSPEIAAANQAALAQAAEAAARANNRHLNHNNTIMDDPPQMMGEESLMNGYGPPLPPPPQVMPHPPPPLMSAPPPGQIELHNGGHPHQPQQLPPMRGKTFVPPSLVPSQAGPGQRMDEGTSGGGSPPPILAPFDPRPNPMACLFCRQRKIRCIGHKPHPCEICVKRGFVCSYDWISRRGKRKPKNQDGSPLDIPAGAVSMAMSPTDSSGPGSSSGAVGVPVVVQPNGPPPPPVGMHPTPGMHPGMPMPGQPGPDGTFPPFAFLPPGAPFPPHPHMAQYQQQHPPPAESLSPSGGSSVAAESLGATEENGMMIDPSLMESGSANGHANGGGAGDGNATCTFCNENDLDCGGHPPETCLNCSRRQLACRYDGVPALPPKSTAKAPRRASNGKTSKKKKRTSEVPDVPHTKKQKTVHPGGMEIDDDNEEYEDQQGTGASADGDAEMERASEAPSVTA